MPVKIVANSSTKLSRGARKIDANTKAISATAVNVLTNEFSKSDITFFMIIGLQSQLKGMSHCPRFKHRSEYAWRNR